MTLGLRRFALENKTPSGDELAGQSRIFLDSGLVEDYARLLPLGKGTFMHKYRVFVGMCVDTHVYVIIVYMRRTI